MRKPNRRPTTPSTTSALAAVDLRTVSGGSDPQPQAAGSDTLISAMQKARHDAMMATIQNIR